MSVKKFEGFIYTCESCDKIHRQEGATGHYTQSTPPGWLSFSYYIGDGGEPYQQQKLVCDECSKWFVSAIAQTFSRRKA